ncbi:MAG: hypothetical protein LIQ31_01585, partial [Planctomycetes bacterium]|nr:hypothetical protein [Planctomycetota bacterium]
GAGCPGKRFFSDSAEYVVNGITGRPAVQAYYPTTRRWASSRGLFLGKIMLSLRGEVGSSIFGTRCLIVTRYLVFGCGNAKTSG